MTLFSNRTTRLIALLSFVGTFMYYQSREAPPDSAEVLVTDGDRVVNLKLSQSEIERLMQVGRIQTYGGQGEGSGSNGSLTEGGSPRQDASDQDLTETKKKVMDDNCGSEAGAAVWTHPALTPSDGSFLRNLDLSAYPKKERVYLKSRLTEMINRTQLVSQMCSVRSRLLVSSPLSLVWHTNHTPNIIWCPIYKASPTWWLANMLRASHLKDNVTGLTLTPGKKKAKSNVNQDISGTSLPPEDPEERSDVFKKSLRVLVVRDPYTRVLAAYLDKIATTKPSSTYFRQLQHKIIKKYRKKKKGKTLPYPTFPEFVQHLADSTRTLHTSDDWRNKVHCWIPYWAQCNVCAADYDLILKMETLEEDEKFLITLANMTRLKNVKSSVRRRPQESHREDHYLRQLDRKQVELLQEQYLLDFEFFGYDSHTYLKQAEE